MFTHAYHSEHMKDQSIVDFITIIVIKLRVINLGVGVIVAPCGFAVDV